MPSLSTTAERSEEIEKQLNDDRGTVKTIKSEFSIDGEPVNIVSTYSGDAKRIVLIEDDDGDTFEVFYE